jgi:hypothetical protein
VSNQEVIEVIDGIVHDTVMEFIDHRSESESLPIEDFERAIREGVLTAEIIIDSFSRYIKEAVERIK